MSFLDIFRTVFSNLKSNKGRSILSILGVVIGIAAVIIIISAGAGAQSLIINQIKSIGSNVVSIMPGKSEEKGPPVSVFGVVVTSLKNDDVKAIKKEVPRIEDAAGIVRGPAALKWQDASVDVNFVGSDVSYADAQNLNFAGGRFFTQDEEDSMARVAIIGNTIKKDLFGESDPIGQRIKIKKENFTVIGVLDVMGSAAFQDRDNQVYIPLSSAQKLLLGINHLNMILIKFNSSADVDEVIEDIERTVRSQHRITNPEDDDFTVENPQQALEALITVTNALKFFLAGAAAISLIVGGIGIMNIMLISVAERTREIGLRKALGATKNGILFQFLIETMLISAMGGIIGIILGIIATFLVAAGAKYLGYEWDFIISILSIALSVSVSIAVGLVFGLWPAYQAAKKEAIEALRYE